jgi:hypothetical protein
MHPTLTGQGTELMVLLQLGDGRGLGLKPNKMRAKFLCNKLWDSWLVLLRLTIFCFRKLILGTRLPKLIASRNCFTRALARFLFCLLVTFT